MRVKYVGRQPYKVDRMFNSGAVWQHPGDVVNVVPDSLAQKMIGFAPGEYGPVSDDVAVREGTHETVGTVPAGDSAIDRIMIPQGGQEVSLRDAKYLTLKFYATKRLGINIATGTSRLQLIDIIVEQINASEDREGDGEECLMATITAQQIVDPSDRNPLRRNQRPVDRE